MLGSPLLRPVELQTRAASRALARLEISYRHPSGRPLEIGVSVTPLATQEPVRRGCLVVFQDLTDIRRLEEEVRTKEKLAAVGEMAAQLAHEIRNPLGSIRGSAQVLSAEPALGEEQGRLLAIISRESKRLSDTLNRFLYQARSPVRPRHPVDLLPVVESAVTLLRNGSEVGADHVVTFEADEGPHVCLADPDQITQVFWNLARNGLEAMPGGGRLDIALRRVERDLVLSVRDEGRGIARDEQRRLFEPLAAAGRPGAGLGLAIVFQIVRQHGGDITVLSAAGPGHAVRRAPAARVGSGSRMSALARRLTPNAKVSAALALMVLATFAQALPASRVLFERDIHAYWYPHRAALRAAVARRRRAAVEPVGRLRRALPRRRQLGAARVSPDLAAAAACRCRCSSSCSRSFTACSRRRGRRRSRAG